MRILSDYGEEISEPIKVAVLISIIPTELQDILFQLGSVGEELRYQEVRVEVVSVAGNRAQSMQPKESGVHAAEEGYDEEYDETHIP